MRGVFNKKNVLIGIGVLALITSMVLVKVLTLGSNTLPLEITYQVRNLSAQERNWRIATAVQPGDVLEHFALIHLSETYPESVEQVSLTAMLLRDTSLRETTLSSVALGIQENTNTEDMFLKHGLTLGTIAPGEFIDLKWQTRVSEDITFSETAVPLLEDRVRVQADTYTANIAKVVLSIFSTQARDTTQLSTSDRVYLPHIIGMNPREVYDVLGSGVVIAGEDLTGVADIRIEGQSKPLVWRLVSNDVIEASIPANLEPGVYTITAYDQNNTAIQDTLGFSVKDSSEAVVVTSVSPNRAAVGEQRIMVMQGVRFTDDMSITLVNEKHTQSVENITIINERVASFEVAPSTPRGEYTLEVEGIPQHIIISIN